MLLPGIGARRKISHKTPAGFTGRCFNVWDVLRKPLNKTDKHVIIKVRGSTFSNLIPSLCYNLLCKGGVKNGKAENKVKAVLKDVRLFHRVT